MFKITAEEKHWILRRRKTLSQSSEEIKNTIIRELGLPTSGKKWLSDKYKNCSVTYHSDDTGALAITFTGAKKDYPEILKDIRRAVKPLKVPVVKKFQYSKPLPQIWFLAFNSNITFFIGGK